MATEPTGKVVRNIFALRKYENGLARQVVEEFQRSARRLELILRRLDPTSVTAGRVNMRLRRLYRAVNAATKQLYAQVSDVTVEGLLGVARAESEFAAGILEDAAGAAVDIETQRIGRSFARAIVSSEPIQGQVLRDWWPRQMKDLEFGFRTQVQLGLAENETIDQIVRRVRGRSLGGGRFVGGVIDRSTRHAATLVRTAVSEVATKAHYETYAANSDVTKKYELVVTFDSRTSDICISLDGKTYAYDDPGRKMPPFHFNALLSGELITSERGEIPIEDIRIGDKVLTHEGRWRPVYAVMGKPGDRALELHVSTGRVLRITDEHPVLTVASGWKRAGNLEVGDKIFQYADEFAEPPGSFPCPRVEQTILVNAHNRPTDQIDELGVPYSIAAVAAGVSAPVDFKRHIGIGECDINDVPAHRELGYNAGATARDEIIDGCLVHCQFPAFDDSAGLGNTGGDKWVPRRIVGATHSHPMQFGQSPRGFGLMGTPMLVSGAAADVPLACSNGGDAVANGNAVSVAPEVEATGCDAVFPLDMADGLVELPVFPFDELPNDSCVSEVQHVSSTVEWLTPTIISIVEVSAREWVWNLAVEEAETYVASGVVVHNCRTTIAPVVDWEGLGIKPPPEFQRAAQGGPIPASQRYGDWLKNQDVTTQNRILGRGRAELWRQGKLDLRDLVRSDGSSITLGELERRLNG